MERDKKQVRLLGKLGITDFETADGTQQRQADMLQRLKHALCDNP